MKLVRTILCGLLIGTPQLGNASTVVAGDSLGVGVGTASGMHTVATVSASISNGVAWRQMKSLPPGTKVYLFLGTNDVGLPSPPKQATVNLLNRARSKKLDVVWVGPPCMKTKRLSGNVPSFDRKLMALVRKSGFRYVSLNATEKCKLSRTRDGVHYSADGYRTIWNLIRN
jgi:lysophospholipase L1-like esterase